MGHGWNSRAATLGLAAILFVSCTSSGSEETTTTAPPTTPPPQTTAAPDRPAPSVEPTLQIAELQWESLNGPPGGRVNHVVQDPYRPEHVYAISGPGLYRTSNQGESWTRQAPEAVRDITSVAFAPEGVYTCGIHGLVLLQPDGLEVPLPRVCFGVAADDEWIYASNWSEPLGEPRVELWRASTTDRAPVGGADWVEVTPPYEALASRVGSEATHITIDELLVVGDSVLATVALGGGAADVNFKASEVFLSRDHGESWQSINPGFPEPLVVQKIRHNQGLTFALAHVNQTDGPAFPLTDLARVSRDGGLTWQPLTGITDIISNTIGDVEVLEDRYVLSNVDFSIAELDKADPSVVLNRVQPEISGFTAGHTIEELVYDVAHPGVIYTKPYLDHEGIARSLDGGQTWQAAVEGIVSPAMGNINVSPVDPNVMIASGNLGDPAQITTDGGQTWRRMSATGDMADDVGINPHDPSHMVFMSEITTLFSTEDGGDSWQQPAAEFAGNRVHSLSLSPDEDVLFSANLGTNVSAMTGVAPGGAPLGLGEDFWFNMLKSPDYAYDLETAPDGTLFASYSPKKFEDFAAVWRYRGSPEGQPEAWEQVLRVPGATGVTDIAIGPGEPYNVYAGVTGTNPGVWASRDGGDTWASLHNDGFGFVTVHAVAIDPADSTVVFAAPWGDGLYRSGDRGATWTQLETPTVSVAAIVVDPLETNHILIGDRTRPVVWESWDSGETWAPLLEFDDAMHYRVMAMAQTDEGLYVSLLDRTPDGLAVFAGAPESGSTFRIGRDGPHPIAGMSRSVLSFADQGDAVYAVTHLSGVYEIHRDVATEISGQLPDMGFNHLMIDEGGLLVAGGSDIDIDFGSRIGDSSVVNNIYRWGEGETWQPLLTGDPFRSPIKQLARHAESGTLLAATETGVYVSTNGGAEWTPASAGLGFLNIGAMALTDDTVVLGTLGAGVAVGTLQISPTRPNPSIDWKVGIGPESDIANIRIEAHPSDPGRLWASSYPGGVFRSDDGGATWIESNFGIPSFQVADPVLQGYYSLALDPISPNRLYLSIYRHGVFVSENSAATWRPLGTYGSNQELMKAELTHVVVDDTGRLWLATADQGVFVSTNSGSTWEPRNEGLGTSEILALEISQAGQVFAGTGGYGVYMLESGADEWRHLGMTIGIGEWDAWDRRLYQYGSFLFDPVEERRVYLGHFPGGFFISNNGGSSWESSNIGMGNDGIFSLTVHPDDPNVILAGTYNGVMRSDDRGEHWRDMSNGMPPEQWPFSVVIDQEDTNVMYTATKNGQNKGFCERNHDNFCGTVMRSTDGGQNWSPITNGLPKQAEYYMLVIDPRDHRVLYVSSSRGVWVSPDQGESWTQMNNGLPELGEFFIRDNVAHNMELTTDGQALVLVVVGYGVYRAKLPELAVG
ncbi:MAG: hypothetical protein QNJ77_10860 [Acidimicrobiia bacterium]|nr:hypothetical protein [Acidimicrobiia bacterium]